MSARRGGGMSPGTKLALAAGVVIAFGAHHAATAGHTVAAPGRAAAAAAISYARHQIGKPYAWGGTGPGAYDCSGLVYEAYKTAGISIPRRSQEQWAWGPRVPAGQEKPGDLVFFAGADGTAVAPGHVGLVIGHHRMIQAYTTGTTIMISTYGTPASLGGLENPVGFTRPSAHQGPS